MRNRLASGSPHPRCRQHATRPPNHPPCWPACPAPQVTFKGDGPLQGIQVIADASGRVKGKVGNPAADPPLRADGKLNVGQAVGRGELRTALLQLALLCLC